MSFYVLGGNVKYYFRAFIVFVCLGVPSGFCDVSENSTQELQLMLNNIEDELGARGATQEEKQERIDTVESQFLKIVNKNSWRNAVIGSVLMAAITAHPVGLLVGGVAGGLVGKSKKYSKAEEQLAAIEYDIIVDEDDFLTEGEIRLARFSGDSVTSIGEVKMLAGDSKKLTDDKEVVSVIPMSEPLVPENTMPSFSEEVPTEKMPIAKSKTMTIASGTSTEELDAGAGESKVMPSEQTLTSCYVGGTNRTRKRPAHCFYMMY